MSTAVSLLGGMAAVIVASWFWNKRGINILAAASLGVQIGFGVGGALLHRPGLGQQEIGAGLLGVLLGTISSHVLPDIILSLRKKESALD